MVNEKVAVVTGSNKGIGFAIVKGLCEKFNGKVYLTARDEIRGKEAVFKLKQLGFDPVFHLLDISDQTSINKFKDHIKEIDGGIDLLINNAAITFVYKPDVPFDVQAEETVRVNYFGTQNVCNTFSPLLRPDARVVNLSSSAGRLCKLQTEELKQKFGSLTLTEHGLNELMRQFVTSAKNGKNEEEGWGKGPYTLSKIGLTAFTFVQQRAFNIEPSKRGISVNAVHPGFVCTDLTNFKGVLTPDEGAKSPLYVALESHGWKGKYIWKDLTVVDWYSHEEISLT